ncbi:MAG: hypothetical protein ACLQBD_26515 [Syntrophobacteraceae bacterium]
MQRFFTGVLCFLVLYPLSGCTTFTGVSNRLAQESRAVLHLETKATDQDSPTAGVCLLDPAASIPETVSPAPAATDNAPIVQLAETAYDFGTMNENKEFVHKFSIRNVGTSQLKIKKIIPG